MDLDNIIRQIDEKKELEKKEKIEEEKRKKEEEERKREEKKSGEKNNKIKAKDYILKPFVEDINIKKDKIDIIAKKLSLTGSYIIDSFKLSFFTYFLQGFTSVEYSTSLLFSGIDKKLKSIDVYVLTRYIRNELLFSYDLTKNKITICDSIINITSNKDLDFLLKNYVKRFDIEEAFANYVKSLLEE